jgi:hypothetical protein
LSCHIRLARAAPPAARHVSVIRKPLEGWHASCFAVVSYTGATRWPPLGTGRTKEQLMRLVKSMMFMMVITGVLGLALTTFALG